MYTRSQIAATIEKPDYTARKVSTFQNAKEIVRELKRAEYNSRGTSRQLAQLFGDDEEVKTAFNTWYWLRSQIDYEAEPTTDQTAKEIKRFIADGFGDCKHYSTFAVGVLNAAGIPAWFSFVGQHKDKRKPNHAYCSALIGKQVYVIDPCRKRFNSECKYYYKWDIPPLTKKP